MNHLGHFYFLLRYESVVAHICFTVSWGCSKRPTRILYPPGRPVLGMAVAPGQWLAASAMWLLCVLHSVLNGGHLRHEVEWQLISGLANGIQTCHGKSTWCRNILWWIQQPSHPIHMKWISINLIINIFSYWMHLKDVRHCCTMHATSKTWGKVSGLRSCWAQEQMKIRRWSS